MSSFAGLGLSELPSGPGVYLMRDASGRIIYIGKANDIKKRVSSYFQKTDVGPKIQALVEVVRRVDYVLCASEREALLLEESWIKKYQPVFNAMWKDDKSYPYVVLTMQEDFPRLYLARKKHIPPGASAFGPYPDVSKVKGLIRTLFRRGAVPLRPCRWDFSLKKPLAQKIINSCLYFHTAQCPAPCAGNISKTDYRNIAQKAARLFSGQRSRLVSSLKARMTTAAKQLAFEEAQRIKGEVEALEHIGERVLLSEIQAEDLASLYEPKAAVKKLQEALGTGGRPRHIEGFDISTLFGTHSVGSMVCFMDGRPNKAHYRRFGIKSVAGIDDFSMMREVVSRRYRRLIESKERLPDLILIDGGLGQLSAARSALETVLPAPGKSTRPALAALAKQEETLYLDRSPGPPKEIRLAKSHEGLKLCMWIRDEAHRFAITYHKKLRKKKFLEAS
ncbi:MAG: excinuclease ABC subunit UvrC [Elusimicrobia bacterium]|nr:excinuclease ABC subunit UvrC [Elusimicrobiota bacterium]